ncbi:MAG: YebC/PmpR family DNA-binding transcriptional regulator [Caldilineaceae bacterium]|nr:YebC/PmpR family DNA-binding transcriptional regulator [Caldilineaceae bacterium]MDE0630388.1 YebC/PmpR family DNA-binding transcriptional regulator [Caldilineaceae bacterium]MXZ22233.1 YebC/PmpR family DNA-binding transcriptional regulator [Caldilineaceae bacterium SB0665_bin_25]
MSGHSKWSTIKRKKGANDNARGKLFTKLARELQVAAREGGPDSDANVRLRLAIEKARAENMPKDRIESAIRRGAGLDKDAADIEEILYEGYAPHGVAVLLECLTDNRNRTIAQVRRCFTRANGNLSEPGSVAWQFTTKGYVAIHLQDGDGNPTELDPEAIFMEALDAGAEDVEVSDDAVEIFTERTDLAQVDKTLRKAGIQPDASELIKQPNQTLSLDTRAGLTVLQLLESLEELDDVNRVHHNLELTDELVAQVA